MSNLPNLFFYSKDINEQSRRQIMPFVKLMKKRKYEIYYNTDWEKEINNVFLKFANQIDFEKYRKANINVKTFIFVFNIFDAIEVRKKIKNNIDYKIILRPRGLTPEESFYRHGGRLKKFILDRLEKKAIGDVDLYCFVTEAQKIHFTSKYFYDKTIVSKSTVVHNYYDDNERIEDEPSITNYENNCVKIVYSGGFSKWQKIEEIFSLIKKLKDNSVEVEFNIYTFETNNKIAEDLLNKYQISSVSEVLNLKSTELSKHIRQNDIGIILRDDSIVNITSSPFKLIDYLSSNIGLIFSGNIGDYNNHLYNKNYSYSLEKNSNGDFKYNVEELTNFLLKFKDKKIKLEIQNDFNKNFNMDFEIENLSTFLSNINFKKVKV